MSSGNKAKTVGLPNSPEAGKMYDTKEVIAHIESAIRVSTETQTAAAYKISIAEQEAADRRHERTLMDNRRSRLEERIHQLKGESRALKRKYAQTDQQVYMEEYDSLLEEINEQEKKLEKLG